MNPSDVARDDERSDVRPDSERSLADIASRSLRELLTGTSSVSAPPVRPSVLELRGVLAETCRAARAERVPVERLLVVLKQAWATTGADRAIWGDELPEVSAAVMTACIKEYFAAPHPPAS